MQQAQNHCVTFSLSQSDKPGICCCSGHLPHPHFPGERGNHRCFCCCCCLVTPLSNQIYPQHHYRTKPRQQQHHQHHFPNWLIRIHFGCLVCILAKCREYQNFRRRFYWFLLAFFSVLYRFLSFCCSLFFGSCLAGECNTADVVVAAVVAASAPYTFSSSVSGGGD